MDFLDGRPVLVGELNPYGGDPHYPCSGCPCMSRESCRKRRREMSTIYDAAVHRVQNLSPFNIQTLDDAGEPVDWWEVQPKDLAPQVVVNPATLGDDVSILPVQILEWSRHVARTQRVWEIRERRLRVWKARAIVAGKEENSKAPISLLESAYRTLPEYEKLASEVDRAAEAHNCATAMLDALKAKRDMMRNFVRRGVDGNPEILAT